MESRLCEECLYVFKHQHDPALDHRKWVIRDLATTSSDCPYCAIIWRSLDSINVDELIPNGTGRSQEDTLRAFWPFEVIGASSTARGLTYERPNTGGYIDLSIFRTPKKRALSDPDTPIDRFLQYRIPERFIVPSSTKSEASINQVRLWLETCSTTHQRTCSRLADGRTVPARLIHIKKRKWRSGYTIRLVQQQLDVEYFCLSHCWGDKKEHCTTIRSNLGKRMERISWEELPNLFQQALEFTYRLGAEYLWIDSLCILQDDDEDWNHEGMKMAGIYANAKLTLAAICAEDSGGKLFYTVNEREIGVKVDGLERFGVTDEICIRTAPPHALETASLLRRAWAFQERLLSPRYLHFSTFELVWECNKVMACQCSGPDIKDDARLHEQVQGRFAKLCFSHCIDWKKEPKMFRNKKVREQSWNMIVQEYSKLGITYRKDRLPAIAGMAKQFRYFGQTGPYLAGLWKDDFFNNLLWHASVRSASMPRPSEWMAPTWSWASAGAGVGFYKGAESSLEVNDRVQLLDAMCEPLHEDDTLNLKSAYVIVSGPSFKATIERKISDDERVAYVLTRGGVASTLFTEDYDLSELGLFHVQTGSGIICMEIANRLIYGVDGFGMFSLVLRDLANGKYERIGIARWGEDIREVSDAAEMGSFEIV